MFRTTILAFIALVSIMCFSFRPKRLKGPPGTVLLKDQLFIDKAEVNNVGWREFEYWNLAHKRDTTCYWKMMQDTTVWGDGSPYAEYYHNHPSFNNYPVVGITYEQILAFCKWRSDRVNELFAKDLSANPFPGKKYRYRLPTQTEWEIAAAGNLDVATFPFGFKDTIGRKGFWKGVRLFNYKHETGLKYDTSANTINRSFYMSPVNSFKPNALGIFNMIGNVSEMVAEKGIAKGGNYSLPLEKCKITEKQNYIKPEAWLGFRCVCEVVAE